MAYDQIVIRLNVDKDTLDSDSLIDVAEFHGLENLKRLLIDEHLPAERVVSSVSVPELLRREREARKSRFPPIHSLTWYWRIDASTPRNPQAVLARLQSFAPSELSLAYIEGRVGLASNVLAQGAPPAGSDKTYLDEAPWGVDARWAWTRPGGTGQKVRLIDLETGWIVGHQDLPAFSNLHLDNAPNDAPEYPRDHGAAVLGVIAGKPNSSGAKGIAFELDGLDVVSHYRESDDKDYFVADAIAVAQTHLSRGDILLIEVIRWPEPGNTGYPAEVDPADHTAIRAAAAAGIVVIEAAGNSSATLNGVLSTVDSGATIVGSCWPPSGPVTPLGHRRRADSNHGARVNCFSWGDWINTAGYGDDGGSHGSVDSYTSDFEQTSGATAIIAGVAAVVQSWVKKRCIRPLDSEQMRTVLSNAATGTPQTGITGTPPDTIGVMPNLRKILGVNLWLKVIGWCLASRFPNRAAPPQLPNKLSKE
jgi:hypothetical protein